MDKQKLRDNLTKLETKTDSFLTRLAESPYTARILAVVILIVVIAWAWW